MNNILTAVIIVYILTDCCPCPGTDGDWSSWGAWSQCTADCRQSRRRSCDNPAPSNGGHFCFGLDEDSQECAGDACRSRWVEQTKVGQVTGDQEAGDSGISSSEIALYVGLSLAVVVLLVVVLVALSLLRRRRLPSGYRLTQSGQF